MKKLLTAAAAALLTTAALPAFAVPREVTGTLLFEDAMLTFGPNGEYLPEPYRPIRYVDVWLKVNGTTVATTMTNSVGQYTAMVDTSQLPVGQTLTLEYKSKNFAGVVKLDLDFFDDDIVFTSSTEIPSTQWLLILDGIVPIGDFSQHMSIADAVLRGREYADARREDSDDIGYVSVEYPDAEWNHYDSTWGDITLSGPAAYGYGGHDKDHGFRDDTVLHEYGHHLEHDISDVDGPSGLEHLTCTDHGNEFAWKEGWATYFAATVRSTWPNDLSAGWNSIEPNPGCAATSTEGIARSILWDLFDGASNEPFDRMDGGTTGYSGHLVRDTLFGVFDVEQDDVTSNANPATNILGFHDHLVARTLYYNAHADMDRIYLAHGIVPHAMSDFSVPSVAVSPTTVIAGKNVTVTMTLNNTDLAYADAHLGTWTTLLAPGGSQEQQLDTFSVWPWIGSQTYARTVTIPSSTPEGTAFLFVRIDPLDMFPESQENNNVLAIPLQVVTCGNSVCSAGESCKTCPKDCGFCGNTCGDGACTGTETCATCPKDCGKCICGDGACQGKENKFNCPQDCLPPKP